VFSEIEQLQVGTIDTVFVFGFFYHTMRHMQLLSQIARLRPRYAIFDTEITLDPGPTILVTTELASCELAGIETAPVNPTRAVKGVPSKTALELMLSSFGWRYNYYDWHRANIKRWDKLEDYHEGKRVSLVAQCY
jgi:hypothetical protein